MGQVSLNVLLDSEGLRTHNPVLVYTFLGLVDDAGRPHACVSKQSGEWFMPVGLLATEVSPPVSVPPGAGLSTVCARVSYRSGEFLMLGVVGMGGESERSRGVRVRQGRPGVGPGRLHRRLRWLAQAAVGRCPGRS